MSFDQGIFLFVAALVGGALNSVAGGGSFISFPALLFTGVSPILANATNTAALWPGTVSSSVAYRNRYSGDARRVLPSLVITAAIGGVVGARILLHTPQGTFMRLVPWLLLAATLLFTSSPLINDWIRRRESHGGGSRVLKNFGGPLLQFAIAVYIGYFGAGVGILILALLAVMGLEDIHAMNAVKTVVVSVANGAAMIAFIIAKSVLWPQTLLMLVGSSIGGYGGAYYAQKMDPKHVRWFVIFIGFAVSLYFFIHR